MLVKLLALLALFMIAFGISGPPNAPKDTSYIQPTTAPAVIGSTTSTASATLDRIETGVVLRAIDGDTIKLSDGKTLRYIGIDTPETVDPRKPLQCFGNEAKEENRRLVEGKTVRLEKDISQTDRYGRLLRYVYIDDVMINEELVKNGFAYSSSYPPDVKHQERFRLAQEEARANKRGLWGVCGS